MTGALTDRTMIKREHGYCTDKATFELHRQGATQRIAGVGFRY